MLAVVSSAVAVVLVLIIGTVVIFFMFKTLRKARVLTPTSEKTLRTDADALADFLQTTSADIIKKASDLSTHATQLREGHTQL